MYEDAHSGTWLRGRFRPNFILARESAGSKPCEVNGPRKTQKNSGSDSNNAIALCHHSIEAPRQDVIEL